MTARPSRSRLIALFRRSRAQTPTPAKPFSESIMIQIIVTIALVGLLVWAITTLVPMPPKFAQAITVIAVVFVVLYALDERGIYHLGSLGNAHFR